MKKLLPLFLLLIGTSSMAHFGVLKPNTDIVADKKDANIELTASFQHPMEQEGMQMAKPKAFGVMVNGKKTDLLSSLKEEKVLGKDAWKAGYKIGRPGVYQFFVEPQPYWEGAEDKYIIHYTKVAVPAFGEDEGWDEPVGMPVEILPLTRPFANYAGNVFTGMVVKDGKPQPGVTVEVEYMNDEGKYEAPDELFVTQTVKTDPNGVFHYAVPWSGWWGFAALMDADEKIAKDGQPKDVETGAVLWTKFTEPKKK